MNRLRRCFRHRALLPRPMSPSRERRARRCLHNGLKSFGLSWRSLPETIYRVRGDHITPWGGSLVCAVARERPLWLHGAGSAWCGGTDQAIAAMLGAPGRSPRAQATAEIDVAIKASTTVS